MMSAKRIFGVALLGSLLVLGGCGGSDSDDNSSADNTGGSSNNGGSSAGIKTTAATIDSNSAQDLGVAAARGIKKAVFDSLAQGAVPSLGGFTLPSGVDLSAEYCESGSLDYTVSLNGGYTAVFNNCTNQGQTVNGTITLSLSSDGDSFTMQQTGLTVTENGQTTPVGDNTITCTGLQSQNFTCTSSSGWSISGDAYQLSDASVEDTGNGYQVEVTVADTEHGSIDVETTVAVTFDCPNLEPGSGAATFTGANGTSGQVNFDSCTSFTVTVDGVAQTYSWADIEI